VDTTSAPEKVTFTNQGTASITIDKIGTSGDFAESSTTCGSSLGADAECSVWVTFKPTKTGTRTGTLTVEDNATNSPQTASLSGIGTSVAASPTSLSFGKQKVDTTSAPEKVTFTNEGAASITIDGISVSGEFEKSTTTCGRSIGAGKSCSVSVTFKPTKTGTLTGTLSVTASSPFPAVPLSGTGT